MDEVAMTSPSKTSSRTNSICLSENDMILSDDEIIMEAGIPSEVENIIEDNARPEKRKEKEESDDGSWNMVKSKEKKLKPHVDKFEMYISCSEQPLPKAFALAKILKNNGITDIERVKYVNPYKVRLDIKSEISAKRLEKCKAITDLGWHTQMAMEKNLSYGVIRDVDLEMTEEDIFNRVTCPKQMELVSVFRLNRRNTSSTGWARSESVRLCFKGDQLPAYVTVEDLKIKVDPYVFPVSQCSQCWQLGHTSKRCPSNKVVCPKCADNHQNCTTTSFKCVNCGGAHMSMFKGCPTFIKEKKLRDIMAESNCTYKKALTIYVAPSSVKHTGTTRKMFSFSVAPTPASMTSFPPLERHEQSVPSFSQRENTNYASVLQVEADVHRQPEIERAPRPSAKKQKYRREETSFEFNLTPNIDPGERCRQDLPQKGKEVKFSELLNRLKDIIFMRNISMQTKVKNGLKCFIEWLILVVVENFSDWPVLKNILDFFMDYGQ